jgi:hypothetical protein
MTRIWVYREEFGIATSAGLGLRQIETLAYACFRGGPDVKKQIEHGNLSWTLKNLKCPELSSHCNAPGLTPDESRFVRNLESCGTYMKRLASCFGRTWNTKRRFREDGEDSGGRDSVEPSGIREGIEEVV